MKELSIEEKAKAYDEAIKQIKECTPDENGFITIYPQEIFPELNESESEDEVTRKAIINFLHEGNPFKNIKKETRQRWIAWLEKQGEHKKFRDSIQVGDKVTRNEDGVLVNLSQLKRVAKPAEWSEEDENQVEDEIVRLSTLNLDKVKNDREISLWKHYFMSLSHEQKSEWKEEDETMLDCIINHFVKALYNTQGDSPLWDDFNEKIDWLKSLKDRYTWKPSDEQIEALESATENCAYSEYQDCLRELIEQLKKLKG